MTLAPPRHDDRQPPGAEPKSPKLGISAVQVIAAALAAATATVAASFLGIAGTVIGAALASVISVTGTAVYSHSFRRTRERVRQRVPRPGTAATRPVRLPAGPGQRRPVASGQRWPSGWPPPDQPPPDQPPQPAGFAPPTYYGQRRGRPSGEHGATWTRTAWRRLAAAAVVVFVAVLVVVTVIELAAGSPLTDLVRGRSGSGTTFFGTHHTAGHTTPSRQPNGPAVLPSGAHHPHRAASSPAAPATQPQTTSAPASSPTTAPPSATPSTSPTTPPGSTPASPTQSAAGSPSSPS